MKNVALFVLSCIFAINAQTGNWKGYKDTTTIWISNTTTKKYSSVYELSGSVANSIVVMVNDTASAGFASDSTKIVYGYQLGSPVLNSSGVVDTAWGVLDTLDTISTVGYGALPAGGRYDVATDLLTQGWGLADTSMVTGYATQIRPLRSYIWAPLMRVWACGNTGTRTGSANKMVVQVNRMVGIPTVGK